MRTTTMRELEIFEDTRQAAMDLADEAEVYLDSVVQAALEQFLMRATPYSKVHTVKHAHKRLNEDVGPGLYRVKIYPPSAGEYADVTEIVWVVNHKNHALNKAAKRGLQIREIEKLEE